MRAAFAHGVILDMASTDDKRSPAAAITVALCGALEHELPRPLAAHHTAAVRDGRLVERGPVALAEADAAHAERLRGAPQQ